MSGPIWSSFEIEFSSMPDHIFVEFLAAKLYRMAVQGPSHKPKDAPQTVVKALQHLFEKESAGASKSMH